MDIKEANKVLEELSKDVRPEMLNDKAKRLFDAIMKIADERDEIKSDLYEANNRINDLLEIVDNKDKIINEMAEVLNDFDYDKQCEICHTDICSASEDRTEYTKCIIDYFTKKVEGK